MANKDQQIERLVDMSAFESNSNNAVEVDGIRFETIVPEPEVLLPRKNLVEKLLSILESLLPIPPRHFPPKCPVQIGIRITNNTSIPLRFSFSFTLFPEIVNANRPIPFEGGWIRASTSLESDYPLVLPGESFTFFPKIELFWIWGNRFGLSFTNGDSGTWFFQPLKPGNYQFRFIYENSNEKVTMYSSVSTNMNLIEGIWTGKVLTPFIELNLTKS
ncbi:hypothetical protein VB713_07570 [Anabaena cylindrica UHCC 0172]|uniref:hypothetical protein n=1 Tax=Anabaena cylindrica TaxID=1165 RepID=UPI002B20B4A9|nr:hypothetical protein [Anabaena cylindrica]MEA5550834.1 hypothetical protein [Anabaena cylindrica UHCC 0172]